MGSFLKFSLLWFITGSPVAALVILLLLWAVADWYSIGFLRRGYRALQNLRLGSRLATEITVNPANRKARADLGDILISQRRFDRAIEVLKPVLAEEPGDLPTLFLMGVACLGAGHPEQGELFLGMVEQADPGFRHGAATLELGRYRLARGDAKGAVDALRRYSEAHCSSVEGHCLLARALEASGDHPGARAERERAWHEHVTALPYQRRMNRLWAWRARPSRPAAYAAIGLAGLLLTSYLVHHSDLSSARTALESEQVPEDEP
ncbi:MAG: tetratricopeptide repeat protein [Deltaproteobacteria bacterium]|nr:tetratricopeptide repeat protein [Deltaproteobacteria bacterium]